MHASPSPPRSNCSKLLLALGVLTLGLGAVACERKTKTEKAVEEVGEAVESIGKAVEEAAGE